MRWQYSSGEMVKVEIQKELVEKKVSRQIQEIKKKKTLKSTWYWSDYKEYQE